jgi:hypothetical protein
MGFCIGIDYELVRMLAAEKRGAEEVPGSLCKIKSACVGSNVELTERRILMRSSGGSLSSGDTPTEYE